MIKLINVSKTYYTKANEVHALDNVNLELPSKGMVFLCGKSGCGKSTLLSILGTLDDKTSGEIYIDEKSIDTFDDNMKSLYRNQSVGFVFQENNLIDDLNVFENVNLSLSIQGKNNDSLVIEALKNVEISELKDRKVNELSGGQKQRVAIARALVKSPSIILCDEPTGALDEENSKTVFDLLKKASENTLVVVVTHDKESADLYSDFIVTLKDGKTVTNNITISEEINNYKVKENKNKMSLKTKLKLGVKSLFRRPVRFTCMLVTLALSLGIVGFLSNYSYTTGATAIKNSMKRNNAKYVSFEKWYYSNSNNSTCLSEINFTFEDFKDLSSKFKDVKCVYVYCLYKYQNFINEDLMEEKTPYKSDGFVEFDNTDLDNYGFSLLCGRLPSSDDELCITDYQYSLFKKFSYSYDYIQKEINNYTDIVGEILELGENKEKYTIVGIVNTSFNFDRYKDYMSNDMLAGEYSSSVHDGIHNSYFFNKGYSERFEKENGIFKSTGMDNYDEIRGFTFSLYSFKGTSYRLKRFDTSVYNLPSFDKDNMNIYVPYGYFFKSHFDDDFDKYVRNYAAKVYSEYNLNLVEPNFSCWYDYYHFLEKNDYSDLKYVPISKKELIEELLLSKYQQIYDKYDNVEKCKLSVDLGNDYQKLDYDLKVGGIAIDDSDTLFVDDKTYEMIRKDLGFVASSIKKIIIPLNSNDPFSLHRKKMTQDEFFPKLETYTYQYSYLEISNEYSRSYDGIVATVSSTQDLSKYFLIVVFPLTMIFMLYFFSGVVIDSKKKIGILRALGVSKKESFMIFVDSGGLISLVLWGVSSIIFSIVIPFEDKIVYKNVDPLTSFVNFNPLVYLLLFLCSFFFVGLGLLVPLRKLINKKPNEVINSI